MKCSRFTTCLLTTILLGGLASAAAQTPFGTEFTYQGQLNDSGVLADGDYDFVFRLYDADTGGAQIGSDFPVDDWPVSDGLFTVQVDFGDGAFNSEARWLEVAVRPWDSNDPHTVLAPRQPVTAAPVALYALDGPGSGGYWTANGDDIYKNNAGGVGIGTTTSPYSMLDVQSTEFVHGIMSSVPSIAVWAHRTATTGTYPAIHGECDSEASYGSAVRGIMTSTSPGSSSAAVRGINNGTGDAGIGVHGSQDGSGYGVYGYTPDGHGVYGRSTSGTGVYGLHDASTANFAGVWGATNSGSWAAAGVRGVVNDTSPGEYSAGVRGQNAGTGGSGIGVFGSQDGSGWGVYGYTPSGRGVYGCSGGVGVYGLHDTSTGTYPGVWGATDSVASNASGVRGFVNSTAPGSYSAGVRGHNNGTGNLGIGVWGSQDGGGWGVYGHTPSGRGVYGESPDGTGVEGYSSNGVGVFGGSPNGYAGYFIGTVRVSVLEIAGADVAEKFPISEEIEPGTVVEIDPDIPGELRMARGAYNRRVAGVVSGAGDIPTGTILGNLPGHEVAPPVALSGRVWVKCDATETAIELGDLLTTSDTPGHAMAVSDFSRAHGAVIGKAMTPLARGEMGMVLVLVNLQ